MKDDADYEMIIHQILMDFAIDLVHQDFTKDSPQADLRNFVDD